MTPRFGNRRNVTHRKPARPFVKMCVAARDRLYVCGFEKSTGRSDNCWYNLVANAFDKLDHGQEVDVLGFDEPGLRIRSDQNADTKDDSLGNATTINAAPPPDWANRAPPPEPEPVQPLSPSRPVDDDPAVRSPLEGDDGDRFKRGALIHRLLESLPTVTPENRLAVTQAFLARPVHALPPERQAEIAKETLAVLGDPEFAPLFGPESQAEVPLSGMIEGRIVSARIDRLLVGADTVTIIDYKTNRPPPLDVADVGPAYLSHMAVDKALLAQIYPGRAITCLLAWTDGPRLMSLPGDLLDRHMP